jgi:flavin reductase (DIM6/NTAB) family NADH-FMN oxidoreductase RutF
MTIRMEPAFDLRSFRRALGHFPTGVCVVTSHADTVLVGMTISSFNSLSLVPPLVLFSIDGKAASLSLLQKAEGYAINMLAENQKDLSDRFAKSGSNKWEGITYASGLFGTPLLPGVAAVLECAAWATHAGGRSRPLHRRGEALPNVRRPAHAGVQQRAIRQASRDGVCGFDLAARSLLRGPTHA